MLTRVLSHQQPSAHAGPSSSQSTKAPRTPSHCAMGSDSFSPCPGLSALSTSAQLRHVFRGRGLHTTTDIPVGWEAPQRCAWLISTSEPPPGREGGLGLNKSVPGRRSPDPTALTAGRLGLGQDPGRTTPRTGQPTPALSGAHRSGPALESKDLKYLIISGALL